MTVFERIKEWFIGLSPELSDFLHRLLSDEGKLLQELAAQELQTVIAGGFSTASFVAAGKDIVAKALAQGKTVLIGDAIAQLNILAAPVRPATTTTPTV